MIEKGHCGNLEWSGEDHQRSYKINTEELSKIVAHKEMEVPSL